jgi:hypothetical protein
MSLSQNRYLSLDVFRGMDVALMIVVNSLGSSYYLFTFAACRVARVYPYRSGVSNISYLWWAMR